MIFVSFLNVLYVLMEILSWINYHELGLITKVTLKFADVMLPFWG